MKAGKGRPKARSKTPPPTHAERPGHGPATGPWHGHDTIHRPPALGRGALDRIERVAEAILGKTRTPGRSAAMLRTRLEDGLGPLDALLQLVPRVWGAEAGAGPDFRSWLVRSASAIPGQRPCPRDPKRGGRTVPVDGARAGGRPFQSGRVFFHMRLAAALAARGRDDFRGMRDGVDVMLRGAEWVESLGTAARHFEATGDPVPFEARANLYFQTRELPGECDLGPPEPFVDDARGCLAFLDAELERAVRATEHDIVQDTRPDVWADTITDVIFHRDGCGGVLEILGAGFGNVQPPHVDLLLPSPEGCRAVYVSPGEWTDQRIHVAAPAWLCTGCVGFGGRGTAGDPFGTRRTAIERVAVALSRASRACSSVFGGPFEPVSGQPSGGRGCPPCTGRNRVVEPLSVELTVNLSAHAHVGSHGTVFLGGAVRCADSVTIVRTGPGPDVASLAPAGPRRFEETRELQFAVAQRFATTTYTLIARPTAACERRVSVTVTTVMSDRNVALMELQRTVLERYGTLGVEHDARHALELRRHGQTYIATHFNRGLAQENVRFAGTGIVFANQADADRVENEDAPSIDPANPSLLLFDDGNRLVGCGFFGFKSADSHPSQFGRQDLIGVAPEEWFVHAAGYHLFDGGFTPDPNPPQVTAPDGVTASGGQPARWHPRTWDLHIFFNIDGAGVPLGPPVVGRTTASFASPPNIPRATAFGVTDPCPGGVGDSGFYEDP